MNGIIIINKPKNCTSHDIVKQAKKVLKEKVGHTGTLDPNATGVLPLLIGKGTEISKYLINHDKTYEATLQLGEKRDTADIEGNVIEKMEVKESILQQENVIRVLKTLVGKQEQIPPIYSAIKINGKKLYEYARKGEDIEITPRKIEIYDVELINIDKENKKIEFRVKCSKGTYIRTLCEEFAQRLGNIGYMRELKRTQVGEFNIENAINIEELENEETLKNKFITVEQYFSKKNKIDLNEDKLKLFLNGVQLTYKFPDEIYKIYDIKGKFIGIGTIKNNLLKRDIIIKE